MAAMPVFISAEPRPYSWPLSTVAAKGGCVHLSSGPVGTTSVWPVNTNSGPSVPLRIHALETSAKGKGSVVNPLVTNLSASKSKQPSSLGVTEGFCISCWLSSKVLFMGLKLLFVGVFRESDNHIAVVFNHGAFN